MTCEPGTSFIGKEKTAVFKMVGTLRFYHTAGFTSKIEGLKQQPDIKDVILDLSEAKFVDNTAFGFVAHLAKFFPAKKHGKSTRSLSRNRCEISRRLFRSIII